ncbi:hypothetical protein BV22DRAFT_802879 [Leucogyrophana mollusca]|uniref:Uncharacterized protein n=1 Tax=Leucogyrophana mollusca TaxID=85980 RepID=A0ACB8B5G4_9AGAM|nr:hypothetical protein BV22DRAFT_802879 [Leucogyrophana mollusca]
MERVDIHGTFGAGYIGGMVTMALYGITTLQTYLYFVYYPNDTRWMKLLVTGIWVLDTLHVSLMCHSLYYYLVSNYSNPSALASGVWSLFASLAINLCIAVLVQTFFSVRIFRLSSPRIRWWLTSLIMVIVIAHFETVILMFMRKRFSALPEVTLIAAMPFALTAVLSDICIAAALCVLLHTKRSVFRRTNILVNTLIVYAINRCLLTSVVAIVEVIVFATSPNSLWFLAIDFLIGKLYANSLLASLNSRSSLRGRGLETDTNSSIRINRVHLSDLRASDGEDERDGRVRRGGSSRDTEVIDNIKDSGAANINPVHDVVEIVA